VEVTAIGTGFNPERIVSARHLEGLTQKTLSELSGISQAKLSKLQNGFTPFRETEAGAIATALDYPVSYFAGLESVIPMTTLTYRKTSKSSMAELSAVSAEYSALSLTAQRLMERLSITTRIGWINEIAPRPETRIDGPGIERLAGLTRSHLGLEGSGPVHNLTRSMERMGIVVAPIRSAGGDGEAKLTSEGVCNPRTTSAPCIGYCGGGCGDRQRFTKAHELGHLILHRYRRPSTPQQTEREAHLFAGALLLPERDARAILTAETRLNDLPPVKSGWGISIAAAISRSYALGIIDRDRYRSMNIQLASRGWKKKEPVNVGVERPLLLRQMIEASFASGEIIGGTTVRSLDAADGLGMPFRYLDYWAGGLREEGADLGFFERRFPNGV
jgi:Zn-dependent peptidase ImmA (M78 family)/transcriptional regulator with XRE-family HTH domain